MVSLLSSDSRFVPVLTNETLKPNVRVAVGFLDFEPSLLPLQDGVDDSSVKDLVRNTPLENRPLSAQDIDNMKRYDALWDHLLTKGAGDIRALLTLNTDVAMGCTLAVRASLTKPSLLRQASLHFPLTHLGLSVNQSIRLFNPSDQVVVVQLHLVHSDLIDGDAKDGGEDSSSFHVSPELMTGSAIPPHGQAEFGPVFFTPLLRKQLSATLYIRNNLTLMQTVVIKGEGGSGKLIFEDAGIQKESLNIVIDEAALGLNKQQHPTLPPSGFEVLRTFIARNSGNLPLFIQEFSIDDGGCQKFGFRLHNCGKFSLKPGEHTSFTVSYRPDFSSSLIEHQLVVTSSLGTTQVPLVATVSPHLLPLLNALQPPLPWETSMRSLGLNSAVVGGILLVAFAAFEWNKGPTSHNATSVAQPAAASATSVAPSETESSKVKPVAEEAAEAGENGTQRCSMTLPSHPLLTPLAAASSQVPAVSAAPGGKTKARSKEKQRRESLEDAATASQSAASAIADDSPLPIPAPSAKKPQQSQRDRSDSIESVSSQSSTQSLPVSESKGVTFAEKPVELEKKQSPPDLKKQAPSILKPSKPVAHATSTSDSHAPAPAPSRAAPPPVSHSKPAATSVPHANTSAPAAEPKPLQPQSAAAGSPGDASAAAQNGSVQASSDPGKSFISGKSSVFVPQHSHHSHTSAASSQNGVSAATPSPPAVILPGSIAHLQPALTAASQGDTLEWNVALDSSDGAEVYVAPGPSTLHSIDKMYRNMSSVPSSFSQNAQALPRPSFADAPASQSAMDDAVLKAKAKEKIKQFVVGDAGSSAPFASGASQFAGSSRPPVPVARTFSAPASTISQPSLAQNQSWQLPSYVPDNSFPAQKQAFPAPTRALSDIGIWGAAPSTNPVPFPAAISTPTWNSFAQVSPQQQPAAVEHVAAQQPSGQPPPASNESLFFFESIDSPFLDN